MSLDTQEFEYSSMSLSKKSLKQSKQSNISYTIFEVLYPSG